MSDWLYRAAAEGDVPTEGQETPAQGSGLDVDQQQVAQEKQNPPGQKEITLDELVANPKNGQEIGEILNWLFQIGEAKATIPNVLQQLDQRLKDVNVSSKQVKQLQPVIDAILKDVSLTV